MLSSLPLSSLVIEDNILPDIGEYLAAIPVYRDAQHIALVADKNTYPLLGEAITSAVSNKKISHHILPGDVKPEQAIIDTLINASSHADLYIGVGSGTVSDIVKYSAYVQKKPYIMCPTAPSMNGYLSANAAIMVKGHKKSLPAQLPQALLIDRSILSCAPLRLIRAGVGDVLCRSTARADWLLSHYVLGTAYSETPFIALKPYEKVLFEKADGLLKGDKVVMGHLIEALLISGYGMVQAGGSYPASQAEHMIAHTMEMKHGNALPPTFHGEQIAVTTLSMVSLQESILRKDRCPDFSVGYEDGAIEEYFGQEVATACIHEYQEKRKALKAGAWNQSVWDKLRQEVYKDYISYESLEKCFANIGLGVTPGSIGWSDYDFQLAIKYAKYSRNRLTFLDISQE